MVKDSSFFLCLHSSTARWWKTYGWPWGAQCDQEQTVYHICTYNSTSRCTCSHTV